jgi:cystathionine beta-lyase/cystathionine gamma-synthase
MGAETALVLALLSPGSTIALAEDAYYGTGVLLSELERWGLRHVLYDQTGPPPAGADLVWIEAPSNPLLTMPDFEAAAAHPGLVVCDATAATPIHLRPLEHGCDLVLHSATKYLAGHHDVLLGAVVAKRPEHAARLHELRTRTGIVAAPDAAWLLVRGLKTLEVRVTRQTETATTLADRLGEHEAVQTVRYPGFGACSPSTSPTERRTARRDRDDADRQRHEPRRRHSRRSRHATAGRAIASPRPAAAVRRPRAGRSALARPRQRPGTGVTTPLSQSAGR